MPVGEDEAPRLHEEAGAVVLDGVDRALALRGEDGGGVVGRGVVVRALLVAERPAARVVEGVRALDEAHAAAVLLDDLLARRPLRLQARDARARRSQLVAQGLHLAGGGVGQLRAQVLFPRPVVLDALLERAALRVRPAAAPRPRAARARGAPRRPRPWSDAASRARPGSGGSRARSSPEAPRPRRPPPPPCAGRRGCSGPSCAGSRCGRPEREGGWGSRRGPRAGSGACAPVPLARRARSAAADRSDPAR